MKKELATVSNDIEKIGTYLETMNLTGKLTKSEVQQFVEISQAFGLNPFKREIYASKFGDKFSIIVGFETYIKRAERTGKLSGWSVTTFGDINRQNVAESKIKAVITINRKDWEHPFIHEVWFEEYAQKTNAGVLNRFWKEKPITMIKKVAMSQGFRLCFSDELGGMPYTAEEIGNDSIDIQHVEINQPESNIMEQKRPSFINPIIEPEPIVIPETIFESISKAGSPTELKSIYNDNPDFQKEKQFIDALSKRKKEVQKIIENALVELHLASSWAEFNVVVKKYHSLNSESEWQMNIAKRAAEFDTINSHFYSQNLFENEGGNNE
jgi:phage recombination protein Bet